jgi:hypothetical protein
MSSNRFSELEQQFRELQPTVEKHVRELMPDAGDELEVVDMNRADGAYWFVYKGRRVRMELTGTKQVVVLVYEGDATEPVRTLPGLLEAPMGVPEMVVLALQRSL